MGKIYALIVAAGSSNRMNGIDKINASINGIPVIARTMLSFEHCKRIDGIIVATRAQSLEKIKEYGKKYEITKLISVILGGDTRAQSVKNGICAIPSDCEYIAIHDGARPLISEKEIECCINDAIKFGASIVAVPVKDTIKAVKTNTILQTPDRSTLYAAQTPQIFLYKDYLSVVEKAFSDGMSWTDDSQMMEIFGKKVHITEGNPNNIKITTPADIFVAESILSERENMSYRIGTGYDVHRLEKGRKLILGGITIPYDEGLLGHSDADVLCHAVTDAVLGAVCLPDIGKMFPDNDPAYEGANSLELLKKAWNEVSKKGYRIENLDTTIIAERPKLAKYTDEMRKNLADALNTDVANINVKATTEEGLGIGEKGIGAQAIVLVNYHPLKCVGS